MTGGPRWWLQRLAARRAARLAARLGPPCPACALPVPPDALNDHLQWHHVEALMALPEPPPRRGARPHRRNGGPTT